MTFHNVHSYVPYSMYSPGLSTLFSPLCTKDQLQLCIHPRSDDVKRQWPQCRYRLPIEIVYPKKCSFTHENNQHSHETRSGSREVVSTPPSPEVAPDFTHHGIDDVIYFSEVKRHHFKFFMSNSRPKLLQECAVTLVTHHRINWHGIFKQKSISAEEH
jgi:hypothetical protein